MMQLTPELLQKHDTSGPRYTSYPTALQFQTGVDAALYEHLLETLHLDPEPVSIYVHLPFCQERCTYCACNVTVSKLPERVAPPYIERVCREISIVSDVIGHRQAVSQIHLGGGTPTYHSPQQLRRMVRRIEALFNVLPDAERSVEVDPRVTTADHLETLASLGFKRLSIGVQDLDPTVQHAIGRTQSLQTTQECIEFAREVGFDSINIDLVYGLPFQTTETFTQTLDEVIALRPERLAVYGFAFMPGQFHHQKSLLGTPIPQTTERYELLALAGQKFTDAGYTAIGIDHFALPTDELAIAQADKRLHRNFMGYTVQRNQRMLGFGVSSIGYVGDTFIQNHKKLADYNACIDEDRPAVERGYQLSLDDRIRAFVITELMCNFQVRKADVEARFDIPFDLWFADAFDTLRSRAAGLWAWDGHTLSATDVGRLFIRNVAMCFDRYIDPARTYGSRTI
jgi:oxygen-independent coproporphyrinogen-3 oxidase